MSGVLRVGIGVTPVKSVCPCRKQFAVAVLPAPLADRVAQTAAGNARRRFIPFPGRKAAFQRSPDAAFLIGVFLWRPFREKRLKR